ncbi:glycosyltransferase [Bryobacter aggregatus]|uniref:glycosyltransferase n=1 Tax=Bryobacter aggregatus TaxID=360054 RepID=UPI0004E19728|nr:glycosyltransferase [Bryobacter aggregatus]
MIHRLKRFPIIRRLSYFLKIRSFESQFNPVLNAAKCGALLIHAAVLRSVRPTASLLSLCRAHQVLMRSIPSKGLLGAWNRQIEASLRRACAPAGLVDQSEKIVRAVPQIGSARLVNSAIVLKAPRDRNGLQVERGVLLLKNTSWCETYHRAADFRSLLQHYSVVVEPSWSGYADPKLLALTQYRSDKILVTASYQGDFQLIQALQSNLVPIWMGASDWVHPEIFHPLPNVEREFDAVLNARWHVVKRHHLLFDAMRKMADPSYKLAIVAPHHDDEGDRALLLDMIRIYGLSQQITIYENLDAAGVNEVLNRSKVNLLLSRQEGSNRAIFEGFFAGVPGLAFENHIGLSKMHFHPDTGRLIEESDLLENLLYFRSHWKDFNPRPWALANIAPVVTTAKLNTILKEMALARGEEWSSDIVPKCNVPNIRYYPVHESGAALPTGEELLQRFPATRSHARHHSQ